MYKPKLNISSIDKGFVFVRDSKKNYLCCNLSKYNTEILVELKKNEINKFSIEESCGIQDFDFLTDFKHLKEIVVSFSHRKLDISTFNKLGELEVLGLPQFVGIFSNLNVENFSFVWNNEEDFADNLIKLKTISVQKCGDVQACIEKIKKNTNLRKVVFNQCDFSSFSYKYIMPDVEEVELQYCNIFSLEPIIDTFPNCKSLLLSNTKKINNYSKLGKLKKLESLSICSSAPIKDVHFISELCMLNTLKIVSTNIESNSTIKDLLCVPNFTFYQTGIDKLLLKNRK